VKRFLKQNWVVLLLAFFTMLSESVHHLSFLNHVHSYSEYNIAGDVVNIPVTWGDVVYYWLVQWGKGSLVYSAAAFYFTWRLKMRESQAIAFSLVISNTAWQFDETMYLFKINTNILVFDGSLNKLVFMFTIMVCTFILFRKFRKWSMKKSE